MALVDTRPATTFPVPDANRARPADAPPPRTRAPGTAPGRVVPGKVAPALLPQEQERLEQLKAKQLGGFNTLTGPERHELWALEQKQKQGTPARPAPLLPHQEHAQQVPDPIQQELHQQLADINGLRDQAKSIGDQYRN